METFGTLSIVATPIGNMEDITLRALRVLAEVDVVFCEDTRTTGKLLKHHGIDAKLKRCDAHKEATCAQEVITLLEEGKRVAYVTDAGTPGISDPGARLVASVRTVLPEVHIEAIPGASALSAALSVAGVDAHMFTFLGFLPHKKGRETIFATIAQRDETFVFYESPHRIVKTLMSLTKHVGDGRRVVLVKEITKIHERVLAGTPAELAETLSDNPALQKGEWVVIVEASA